MPGFDGTGPMGRGLRTGWGRGWCRPVYPVQRTEEKSGVEPTPTPEEAQRIPPVGPVPPYGPVVYGVGRGGIPWGCGRGFCGGRFRGRGRGRYWW